MYDNIIIRSYGYQYENIMKCNTIICRKYYCNKPLIGITTKLDHRNKIFTVFGKMMKKGTSRNISMFL